MNRRIRRMLHKLETPAKERMRRREYDAELRKLWYEHREELSGTGIENLMRILAAADAANTVVGMAIQPNKISVRAVSPNTPAKLAQLLDRGNETAIRRDENFRTMLHGAILAAAGVGVSAAGHGSVGHILSATGVVMSTNRLARNVILQHNIKEEAYKLGWKMGEYIHNTFRENPDAIYEALKSAAAIAHDHPAPTIRQLGRGIGHSILELRKAKSGGRHNGYN